jgi:flagellar assembly protein FliH
MNWSNVITLHQPLADVQLQVKPLIQDPVIPAHEHEKSSYEEGRRDAEQALSAQLMQQRNEIFELQNGILHSLKQMLPQMAQEMEAALIELAMESAKKISGSLKIDTKLVENVVREALGQVQDTSNISVQLHPDDLALLTKHKSPLLTDLPENGHLRFAGSTEITRGGCIVQTRFGIIDAQRETKLQQLRKAVNL